MNCSHCDKPLIPIRSDWETRKLHKACWKKLNRIIKINPLAYAQKVYEKKHNLDSDSEAELELVMAINKSFIDNK